MSSRQIGAIVPQNLSPSFDQIDWVRIDPVDGSPSVFRARSIFDFLFGPVFHPWNLYPMTGMMWYLESPEC